MYPSDYGYATSGGTTTNRASCLSKEMYNWDDSSVSDCKNNDWMYNLSRFQWTITPGQGNTYNVFFVYTAGVVITYASSTFGVRPVVHLNSAIKVITGSGTKESPYVLEQKRAVVDSPLMGDVQSGWTKKLVEKQNEKQTKWNKGPKSRLLGSWNSI